MYWKRLAVLQDSDMSYGSYSEYQPDLNFDETSRLRIAVVEMWERYFRLDATGRNEIVLKVNEIAHP